MLSNIAAARTTFLSPRAKLESEIINPDTLHYLTSPLSEPVAPIRYHEATSTSFVAHYRPCWGMFGTCATSYAADWLTN